MWFMFVIPFIIFFVVFLMIAKSFFGVHKKAGDTMQDMIDTVSKRINEVNNQVTTETSKSEIVCEYCGSGNKSTDGKCASCGAKIKRNDKSN